MSELQQQASDPQYSVWVSASAGTGKTKTLIDRVLRLLISGTPFKKILCLTFTNAAAIEIHSRIRYKLNKFAVEEPIKLTEELGVLLTRHPLKSEIQYAKTLYCRLHNSEDDLNIYTIHTFCQKMLKLFPLEAGINPAFQIIDDITAQGIINIIINQIYLDPIYNDLISFFLTNFHEATIDRIISEIMQQKIKFKKLFTKQIDDIEYHVPTQQLLLNLYDQAKQLLVKYSITINLEQEIQQIFFTKEYNKRKNILSKSTATKHPKLLNELKCIQEKIFQLDQQIKIQDMENYSGLLCNLARIFLDKYDSYKIQHNLLDYDDLIHFTQLLLRDNTVRDWISYKLDGGIDHLLVDEAQDNSSEQWDIITAIIAEFYSSTKAESTIFVVGDEKQSIFSFQGANFTSFNNVNQNLYKNLFEANKNFKNITLELCYRSTKEILDIVYLVLQQIKDTNPQLFTSDNPKILSFRQNHKGKVELWPLVKCRKKSKVFWPLPFDHDKFKSAQQLLAQQIVSFIKSQMLSKKILPATNSEIRESDFMILVRKRDKLAFEIINCLKKHGLQVENIDRITLDESLLVLDLMSIAKFVILPHDNLNLMSLLKSPIIGMCEQELQTIAVSRGKNSIWVYLQKYTEYTDVYKKLCYFLQIYKIATCHNFFSLIIDCLDTRKILVEYNGLDSNDLINELIYLSSNYAHNIDSSLQNFIYWFENNEIEIKRNIESSGKIKVMTVHASKGLQAPIVILCDTSSVPINNNKFIWDQNSKMVFAAQSSNIPKFFKDLKEEEQQKHLQEYIRLLYVAMTRAEDHLVVCGYQSIDKIPQNCWYELVSKVMNIYGKIDNSGIIVYETATEEDAKLKKYYKKLFNNFKNVVDLNFSKNNIKESTSDVAKSNSNLIANKKLPKWTPNLFFINKITKNTKQNYSINSPFIATDYLEYGKIFHKILEDSKKINEFSSMREHLFIHRLSVTLQQKIHQNINKLLNNTEFMALMSQEIKTEVTIGKILNDNVKIGRIDLLAIGIGELTIVDYKSDVNPPRTYQLVKKSYIDQLNFYRHIIAELYPNNEIICKILWLENANFMTIS